MRGIYYLLYHHPSETFARIGRECEYNLELEPMTDSDQFRSYSFWLGKEGE